jgi:hypothetical protein
MLLKTVLCLSDKVAKTTDILQQVDFRFCCLTDRALTPSDAMDFERTLGCKRPFPQFEQIKNVLVVPPVRGIINKYIT